MSQSSQAALGERPAMHHRVVLAAGLLVAAVLAGCTGNFDVKQTEPLRVRVEHVGADGTTGTTGTTGTAASRVSVKVDADGGDGARQTIVVDRDVEVERIDVVVTVTAVATGGTVVTNGTGGNGTGGNETGGNQTGGDGTGTTAGGDVVINVIVQVQGGEILSQQQVTATGGAGNATLNVDVKGKDNVVIITEAVQGAATVDVDVKESAGQGGASG